MKLDDLTGRKFGRLVVICRAANIGRKTAWLCKCDCGNTKVSTMSNLKSGHVTSCGCAWKDIVPPLNKDLNTRHAESGTQLYRAWTNMRYRCNTPTCQCYKNYGGRGITICKEWGEYESFRDWALNNGFMEGLSIDRIDVDGNYEPSNCRWVSDKTQQNNKRNNVTLTFGGQTHTLQEWSEMTGINWTTLKRRINAGWNTEDTLTRKP